MAGLRDEEGKLSKECGSEEIGVIEIFPGGLLCFPPGNGGDFSGRCPVR